ncbi:MAG: hypothetical protein ACLVJ6_12255 [Merdibacter sp.]
MYTAISNRDYNVLMGVYLIIAVSVAAIMILVDLVMPGSIPASITNGRRP